MILAPGFSTMHSFLAIIAIFALAIGAGASGAVNMWYDRDIDLIMNRTKNRAIPAGKVPAAEGLTFALILCLFSVVIMGLAVNWVAAGILAFAIIFYAVFYTMILKRHTSQNIVIGGAAGAFPPMIGWAAVTGDVGLGAIILFLIIFLWTPPHTWALALFRRGDYEAAGVPMLPVVAGERETKRQMLIYTALLVPTTLLPVAIGMSGALYGIAATGLGLAFARHGWRVWKDTDADGGKTARPMFFFSIMYLFLIFFALLADRMLFFPVF